MNNTINKSYKEEGDEPASPRSPACYNPWEGTGDGTGGGGGSSSQKRNGGIKDHRQFFLIEAVSHWPVQARPGLSRPSRSPARPGPPYM